MRLRLPAGASKRARASVTHFFPERKPRTRKSGKISKKFALRSVEVADARPRPPYPRGFDTIRLVSPPQVPFGDTIRDVSYRNSRGNLTDRQPSGGPREGWHGSCYCKTRASLLARFVRLQAPCQRYETLASRNPGDTPVGVVCGFPLIPEGQPRGVGTLLAGASNRDARVSKPWRHPHGGARAREAHPRGDDTIRGVSKPWRGGFTPSRRSRLETLAQPPWG